MMYNQLEDPTGKKTDENNDTKNQYGKDPNINPIEDKWKKNTTNVMKRTNRRK